jgi:hypothetical protein
VRAGPSLSSPPPPPPPHPLPPPPPPPDPPTTDGTRPVWLGQPYTETDRERGLDRMAPGRVGILVRADAGDPVGPAKQAADWYHLRATGTCDPVAVPLGDPMLICEVAP